MCLGAKSTRTIAKLYGNCLVVFPIIRVSNVKVGIFIKVVYHNRKCIIDVIRNFSGFAKATQPISEMNIAPSVTKNNHIKFEILIEITQRDRRWILSRYKFAVNKSSRSIVQKDIQANPSKYAICDRYNKIELQIVI